MYNVDAATSRRSPEPQPERQPYRRDIDCAPPRRADEQAAGPRTGRGRGTPDPERWVRRDDRGDARSMS